MQGNEPYYNNPGYLPARQFIPPTFLEANVPGQGPPRDEYRGSQSHYFPQGEGTHPRNEVGHRGASSHVPVPPGPQLGMGHGTSVQQPPMGRNHHPAFHQLYPAQPANVPHPLQPFDFVQPRQAGPMIATRSQFRGSVGVQNPPGRLSYAQSTSSLNVLSSPVRSFPPMLPVPPGQFGLMGQHNLPPQMQCFSCRTGKRRALLIGINYAAHPKPSYWLRSCREDAYGMANFLRDKLDFAPEDIRIMTDEILDNLPTKENILREMRTLVHDAQPHDSLFFYFSGHAVQIKGLNPMSPGICAINYRGNDPYLNPGMVGLIPNNIIQQIIVESLPSECRLTAIFDTCYSGALLGLPYLCDSNGVVEEFRHPNGLGILRADVVALSASKGNQTALETRRGGLLQRAFTECMTKFGNNVTYRQLIGDVCEYMQREGFPQQPQLSSSHRIDTNLRFVHRLERR